MIARGSVFGLGLEIVQNPWMLLVLAGVVVLAVGGLVVHAIYFRDDG